MQASNIPGTDSRSGGGQDASASNSNGAATRTPDSSAKPVRASMERKLTEALQPESLTILDESSQHAGHAGSRMLASPSGETHFKVIVVSSAFEGLNTVKRHRLVYKVSSMPRLCASIPSSDDGHKFLESFLEVMEQLVLKLAPSCAGADS